MRRGEVLRSALLLAAGWTLGNYSRLVAHDPEEPATAAGLHRRPRGRRDAPSPPRTNTPLPNATRAHAHQSSSPATNASVGVAVTVLPPRGRNALIAAQLATVAAALPARWLGVDVYYRPGERGAPCVRAVLAAVAARERVAARPLAAPLEALPQRALLLHPEFWRRLRAPRVLWFEAGAAVLCAAAPLAVDAPLFAAYDWVGAPWVWGRPGTRHGVGGNGALSLRSRDVLVALFDDTRARPRDKGNEDMWWVAELQAARALPSVGRAAALAPFAVGARFSVEESYETGAPTPVGVYHLMRTMPHANRTALLARCPEAKLLFPASHDPRCGVACPADRALLDAPLRAWRDACSGAARDAARCDLRVAPGPPGGT